MISCILTLMRFSKLQCGFRKGYNAEQCLISMTEKWYKAPDVGDHAGALLTDFSEAFDRIGHELLLVKLNAYSLDSRSLYFLFPYLDNRKQRTKVNSSYSDFNQILTSVSQGINKHTSSIAFSYVHL